MYKIRAKSGYNVILKDLNITLQPETNVWHHISKESYNNSTSVAKLSHLIIKEDLTKNQPKKEKKSEVVEELKDIKEESKSKIFVKDIENELKVADKEINDNKEDINITENIVLESVEVETVNVVNNEEVDVEKVAETVEAKPKSKKGRKSTKK